MICVEFVLHILTNEQNEHRVPTCEDFIWTSQTSPHFLNLLLLEMSLLCFSTTLIEKLMHGVENKSNTVAQKILLMKAED